MGSEITLTIEPVNVRGAGRAGVGWQLTNDHQFTPAGFNILMQ